MIAPSGLKSGCEAAGPHALPQGMLTSAWSAFRVRARISFDDRQGTVRNFVRMTHGQQRDVFVTEDAPER
eukprot:4483321-Prorocentrum_lima.AAC.1